MNKKDRLEALRSENLEIIKSNCLENLDKLKTNVNLFLNKSRGRLFHIARISLL